MTCISCLCFLSLCSADRPLPCCDVYLNYNRQARPLSVRASFQPKRSAGVCEAVVGCCCWAATAHRAHFSRMGPTLSASPTFRLCWMSCRRFARLLVRSLIQGFLGFLSRISSPSLTFLGLLDCIAPALSLSRQRVVALP